jgi:hypothetical protein
MLAVDVIRYVVAEWRVRRGFEFGRERSGINESVLKFKLFKQKFNIE